MKINIMFVVGVVVLLVVLSGCRRRSEGATLSITNGTTVLLFSEWEHSSSRFERLMYTNYYGVYRDGNWYTRERQDDGSLAAFWKSDSPEKTLDRARGAFAANIQWNVYKALHDALCK